MAVPIQMHATGVKTVSQYTADAQVPKGTSSSTGSFLTGGDAAVHGLRARLLPSDTDLVILRVCLDSICVGVASRR